MEEDTILAAKDDPYLGMKQPTMCATQKSSFSDLLSDLVVQLWFERFVQLQFSKSQNVRIAQTIYSVQSI